MNTQSSVQISPIACRLFWASRSPNTSWRLRLIMVSMTLSTVLAPTRKRAECGAQFLDEYGGLLEGREMSAMGGFVPIEEPRIDPLAPQARRLKHFARENAHRDRQIELLRREIGRETLGVEARGGCGGVWVTKKRGGFAALVARDFPPRVVVAFGPPPAAFLVTRRLGP